MSAIASEAAVAEQDWKGCRVALHGLQSAAALNGREGTVQGSVDEASGRYEVNLDAGKGADELARTITVKPTNLKPARPTALTARPGQFRASYDWREVLPGQELPRGLEILSSIDEKDTRPPIARIPPKWKLDIAMSTGGGGDAPQPGDQAPMRMDVGARTTIGEVQAELRKHLQCPERAASVASEGWPALFVNGTRCADPTLTVTYAQMFGAKVWCCIKE